MARKVLECQPVSVDNAGARTAWTTRTAYLTLEQVDQIHLYTATTPAPVQTTGDIEVRPKGHLSGNLYLLIAYYDEGGERQAAASLTAAAKRTLIAALLGLPGAVEMFAPLTPDEFAEHLELYGEDL